MDRLGGLMLREIAHRVLPAKEAPRRLLMGLAKGCVANIDFKYDAAYYFGRHEPDLFPYYRKMIKRGMKCFDLGTYRGWDALNLAYLSGSNVVSFDCNPQMLEAASKLIEPSDQQRQITLVNVYFSDGSDGSATLDDMSEKHGSPDFIKMDIEGAEAIVLAGASKTLSRRPNMIIETHGAPVEDACVEILNRSGYQIEVVRRSKFFSEARGMEHNRWLACTPKH